MHENVGILKIPLKYNLECVIDKISCYVCRRSSRVSLPEHISMMTSSNGNIFRVTGHMRGNSSVTGEFPAQRPVTRSFDVFFGLRLE